MTNPNMYQGGEREPSEQLYSDLHSRLLEHGTVYEGHGRASWMFASTALGLATLEDNQYGSHIDATLHGTEEQQFEEMARIRRRNPILELHFSSIKSHYLVFPRDVSMEDGMMAAALQNVDLSTGPRICVAAFKRRGEPVREEVVDIASDSDLVALISELNQ